MTDRTDKMKAGAASKKTLLVARESSTGSEAQVLLGHLFHTIVKGLESAEVEIPDFGDIVELFQRPHGDGVTEYRRKGMKAVQIDRDNHGVLLSLGSARKVNASGDNHFVDVLVEVLDSGEYDRIVTTSISRLCRSTVAAGKLQHALDQNRVKLLLAEHEIEVWDPMAGQLIWTLLVWFASFEAQQIEARLTAGKVARATNGEWAFGYAPPPGWRLTDEDTVEPDPESAAAVRWVIAQVLAGETNFAELARGVLKRWPDLEARRGTGLLSDQANPGNQLRRSWLHPRWMAVYGGKPYQADFVPYSESRKPEHQRDPGLINRVTFHLPEHEQPILTEAEIEMVSAVLENADSSAAQAKPGTSVGAALKWDADDVVIDPVLLGDQEPEEGRAA